MQFQLENLPTNAYQNNDNKVLKVTMKYRHEIKGTVVKIDGEIIRV
jgi:hypothetical protein